MQMANGKLPKHVGFIAGILVADQKLEGYWTN